MGKLLKKLLRKMNYIQCLVLLMAFVIQGGWFSSCADAADFSFSSGYFDPESEGLDSQYDTERMASAQLNIPYHESFEWVLGYTYVAMESNIDGISSDLTMNILNLGTEKRFDDKGEDIPFTPFVGFGISRVKINGVRKEEKGTDNFEKSTQYSWGSYWEVGVVGYVFDDVSLVLKYTRQHINKTVFGDLSVGGRFMQLGIRLPF